MATQILRAGNSPETFRYTSPVTGDWGPTPPVGGTAFERIAPSSAPVCALGHLPPKGKAYIKNRKPPVPQKLPEPGAFS